MKKTKRRHDLYKSIIKPSSLRYDGQYEVDAIIKEVKQQIDSGTPLPRQNYLSTPLLPLFKRIIEPEYGGHPILNKSPKEWKKHFKTLDLVGITPSLNLVKRLVWGSAYSSGEYYEGLLDGIPYVSATKDLLEHLEIKPKKIFSPMGHKYSRSEDLLKFGIDQIYDSGLFDLFFNKITDPNSAFVKPLKWLREIVPLEASGNGIRAVKKMYGWHRNSLESPAFKGEEYWTNKYISVLEEASGIPFKK